MHTFLRIRRGISFRVPIFRYALQSTEAVSPVAADTLPSPKQQRSERSRLSDAAATDFRFLKSVDELQSIIERLGSRLTGSHLSSAFSRLHQLSPFVHSQTVALLTDKATQLAPSMSAHEIVFLLAACSRLKHIDASLFEALSRRLLSRECMLQLNEIHVAQCVMSLAVFQKECLLKWTDQSQTENGAPAPLTVNFEVMQELARLVQGHGFLQRARTSAIVNIVYGFGLLRFQSPAFVAAVTAEFTKPERLRSMSFNQLVRLWTAMAQLKVTDGDTLDALCEEMCRVDRLRGFRAYELQSIFSTSRHLLPFRNAPFLLKLIQELVKPDRMRRLTETQLVGVVEALQSMRVRDEGVMDALLEELTKRNRLPFLTQQSLSTVVYSLKSLGYNRHPKMQILLEHADQIIHERHLSDQQLLSFVFGRRHSEAEDAMCSKMLDRILTPERIGAFSDQALSGILAGLHQREVTDRAKVHVCVAEIVKRLNSATPEVLSYYAYGLRIHKIDSQETLAAFASAVILPDKLNNFKPSELAGVAFTLGMLGWKSTATYNALFDQISQKHNLNQTSEKGLANVVTAIQCSRVAFSASVEAILTEATQSHRLLQFSERSLMSLVRSFGRMRFRERKFTTPVFWELTKPGRLARLTNLELSDLIYNLAQIRFKAAAPLEKIKQEVLKSHRLPKFAIMEFCNVVYGLGGIRLFDQDWMRAIASHIDSSVDISTLRNCELTNLIHGLGNMRCTIHPCISKLLTEVMHDRRLASLSGPELTSLVYGMGNFPEMDASFTEKLLEAVGQSSRLPSLSDQQLTNIFVAMVHLLDSIPGSQLPASLLEEMLNADRLRRFQSFQLMDVIEVLRKDALRPHRTSLAEALAQEVSQRLPSMTQVDLTITARRLGQVGCHEIPAAKSISAEVLRRFHASAEDRKDDITE